MKFRLLPIVLFAILISAVPLFAQSDTEVYEDGLVTFEYPADWLVEVTDGLITVTNTAEAAEAFQAGEDMSEGMLLVVIAHISTISTLEPAVDPDWSPLEVVEYLAEDAGTSGEITEAEFNGFAAAQVEIITDEAESAGVQGAAAAFDTPNGVVVMILETGDTLDDYGNELAILIISLTMSDEVSPAVSDAPSGETIRQWAIGAEATSQYGDPSWSAAQATGEPDTSECGDYTSAWASSSSTGQDTLTLEYAVAVIPQEISVYQTYNPGSIISVSLITVDGETITLPDSADPPGNTDCPGVFKLNVEDVNQLVTGVIVELDQSIGGSWNEIDAVELVGVVGEVFTGWTGEGEITDDETSQGWEGTFEGGETITITVVATSGNLDPVVQLYSVDDLDVPLAENDDSRDEALGFTNSRIEDFEIEDGGDYVIVVTRFGGEGDYTLLIEGADGVEFEPQF